MNDLAGKNVLFIAPKFFDYDRDIFRELSRRGASVDLLRDRPFDSAAMVALTRFARFTVMPAVERHYSAELERLGRSHYDLVFVINGQTLPLRLLRTLRTSFANARFVLYMWDSIGNRPSTLRHIHYFDHVFTFDRRDADEYGLKFRPLFYSQDFDLPSSDFFQYDISFIGTAHSDRVKVVSDIDRSLPVNTRCFWHLYLQAPWVL